MMDTVFDIDEEYQKVMDILNANKDKNFVKRILSPDKYPTIDNGDGTYSTHLMAWSDAPDGKYRVYPTITYDTKSKSLTKLEGDAAYSKADSTGDYIEFETPEEADWFSRNYKKAWNK